MYRYLGYKMIVLGAEIHDDMVAVEHSAREIILDGQLRVQCKERWCLELI